MIIYFWVMFIFIAPFLQANETTQTQTASCTNIDLNLSFQEMIELQNNKVLNPDLQKKLDFVLQTPITGNYAIKSNGSIEKNQQIIVGQWNIERGLKEDKIVTLLKNTTTTDMDTLLKDLPTDVHDKIIEAKKNLEKVDIWILNEVDIGMPRTGYRNVCDDVAKKLELNYVFVPEFIELDPCHMGISPVNGKDCQYSEERALGINETVQKDRYKGLHGSCILSKKPIKNIKVARLPDCYNWWDEEKKKIGIISVENLRRKMAKSVFKSDVFREIRRGGRMAIFADVETGEGQPNMTVVGTHLENRTTGKCRSKQIEALSEYMAKINNPVVLGGDLNTVGSDASQTNASKIINNKVTNLNFWGRLFTKGLLSNVITPLGAAAADNALLDLNAYWKWCNPMAFSWPLYGENPERAVFNKLKELGFDPRWECTNERHRQITKKVYYEPTLYLENVLFHVIGKFKADGLFFKKGSCYGANGSDPQTYKALHELDISDHVPISASFGGLDECSPVVTEDGRIYSEKKDQKNCQ